MRAVKSNIETYTTGIWCVDIIEQRTKWGTEYAAWIYRKNNGIKQHMYGVNARSMSKEVFTAGVLESIKDYKAGYDDVIEDVEAGNWRRLQAEEEMKNEVK